jgi:hypothetical protein
MNLPVQQTNQLPSDPAQLADYYKQYAETYASTERRAGSSVSIRNGVMSVGDQAIPGNQFAAIIIDAARLNTFYNTAFNPQVIAPPVCYAIGRNDAEMAPHPDMAKDPMHFQPQAERCGACPHNEFGSGRTGTGKACANRRRLLMILAGTYLQGSTGWALNPILNPEHYASSPFLTMTLAPTTLVGWGQWVRDTAAQYQRPMFGVIARVFLYTHPKHGKEAVGFETLAPTPDEWAAPIIRRHQEAQREIMEGYEPPQNQQRGGGFYQAQNNAQTR